MKKQIENTMQTNNGQTTGNPAQINENHLYNLLFAGKISLKEYFQEVGKRATK